MASSKMITKSPNGKENFGFQPLTKPPTFNVMVLSAGVGACFADLVTYPFDTMKIRLQIQSSGDGIPRYNGLFGTLKTIVSEEGFRGLYSGLVPGLQRQFAFSSLRIGLYDPVKNFYAEQTGLSPLNMAVRIMSGISTGAVAVMVAQPTDVVKVRLQAQGAQGRQAVKRYSGSVDAYKKIVRLEGIRGLWTGLMPSIGRNAVVNASEMVSYDVLKHQILMRGWMEDTVKCHVTAAAGAGLITTIVASPIDVVKTRYMSASIGQYTGVVDCARKVYRDGGVRAFYRGLLPGFLRIGTWNVIMFVVFEQLKRGFTHASDSFTMPTLNHLKATAKADTRRD